MSFAADFRGVSDSAIDRLADRFDGLPRPLLAAIGAGDFAVEQLAVLRESLFSQLVAGAPKPPDLRGATDYVVKAQQAAGEYVGRAQETAKDYIGKAQGMAGGLSGKTQQAVGDLPGKAGDLPKQAQQIAAEVAESIQTFATQIPTRAQGLVSELPEKVAEFTGDLSAETVRDTVEAYTKLVGSIYGILADRGDRSWSKVRSSSLRPGTVVDAKPEPPKAASTPATTDSPKATSTPATTDSPASTGAAGAGSIKAPAETTPGSAPKSGSAKAPKSAARKRLPDNSSPTA